MSEPLEETFIDQLNDWRRWLDELKTAQRVGAASLVLVSNRSSAAVDLGATIPAAGRWIFSVTFTASRQDYALTTLDLVFYSDAGATVAIPPARIEERLVMNPRVTTWDVTVENPSDLDATTLYVKRVVNSTDSGVIS